MDALSVERSFAAYLADFVALGRGDSADLQGLLRHYSVPLLVGTDSGCTALADEGQVLAFARQQIADLRSAEYDRSHQLAAETILLNRSCATHRVRFSRLRYDGTEIARLEATYLITDGAQGRRISAIVVHSAP